MIQPVHGIDNEIDEAELAELAIRRVEENVFQRGDYLYHNLGDAIDAAKKDRKQ